VALLGHSLGGLLLRHALADVPSLAVHRLIMLGTPNRSPRRARAAIRWLPYRLFSRSCGALLASPAAIDSIPVPRVDYTVIAGTGGPRWLARSFGTEPNDGIVAVAETLICDDDIPLLVPRGHTFLMNAAAIHRTVLDLLASNGRVPIVDAVLVPGTTKAGVQSES
jgi:pimeloyl-ACP methyl ester carboxylesterase